jgi:hypothetical protein
LENDSSNISPINSHHVMRTGKEKEVLAMENGGNKKVNLIFEAHLNVSKPSNTASGPVRERFIRDKYERRKFYDPNAFVVAEQMTPGEYNADPSAEEEQQVIAGVQRRLAAGSYGNNNSAPSIRKPSDAARKRVEERAARNRVAGGVSSSVPAVRSKPIKTPVAPAPAPVVDLLDFGDFDSPEATAAVASTSSVNNSAPVVAAASNTTNEPALDLFANMSVGDTNGAMPPQQQQQQQAQQQKMSTADIMNMFNTPNQNAMQQNMFGMGGGMPSGMQGGNMMMNQNTNQANYNNMMMPTNNYGGGMNGQMMMNNGMGMKQGNNMMMAGNNMNMFNTPNQNAMQQNMFAMSGGMPSGMQGGMNNHMMMNNGMGMQQQQQQMQMNGMQGGVMMGQGNNQFGQPMQQQAQKQSRGISHDQFADFGNFGR